MWTYEINEEISDDDIFIPLWATTHSPQNNHIQILIKSGSL